MPALTLPSPIARPENLGGAEAMGATLRELRTRAGITQRELATREGLHRNYLGALERGTVPNPGLATANRLARALDVSIAVLAESFVRPRPLVGQFALHRADAPLERRLRGTEPGARALGRALRLMRHRSELTRAVLADATEMHKNYIGSLEDGAIASPGLLTLTRLVHGLHAPSARDSDRLATSVGVLACVFAGEPVLVSFAA